MRKFSLVLVLALVPAWLQAVEGCYDPNETSGTTFEDVKADIQKNGIRSSEEMLAFFAKTSKYQPIVQNPVFLKVSNAIHGEEVTAAFPRIEGTLGNLTMHMTSDPAHKGPQFVEFIEFIPKEAITRFHAINFELAGTEHFFLTRIGKLSRKTIEIHQTAVGGEIDSCVHCHGNTRQLWPFLQNLDKPHGGPSDSVKFGTKEYDDLKSFQKTIEDLEKNRYLRSLTVEMKTAPNGDISFSRRPNARFTENLHRKDAWVFAKRILEDENFAKYRFATVAAFFDCTGIREFLPVAARKVHENGLAKSLERFSKDVAWSHEDIPPKMFKETDFKEEFRKLYQERLNNPGSTFTEFESLRMTVGLNIHDIVARGTRAATKRNESPVFNESYASVLTNLRYVLDGRLKENEETYEIMKDFFGDDGEGRYPRMKAWFPHEQIHSQYVFPGGLPELQRVVSCHIGPGLLADHPDLRPFFRGTSVHPDELVKPRAEFCGRLREKSLAAW